MSREEILQKKLTKSMLFVSKPQLLYTPTRQGIELCRWIGDSVLNLLHRRGKVKQLSQQDYSWRTRTGWNHEESHMSDKRKWDATVKGSGSTYSAISIRLRAKVNRCSKAMRTDLFKDQRMVCGTKLWSRINVNYVYLFSLIQEFNDRVS